MSETRTVWVARDEGCKSWQEEYSVSMREPMKIGRRYYVDGEEVDFGAFDMDVADLLGLTLEAGECDRFEITVRRVGNET